MSDSSLLSELGQLSAIVPETADLETIGRYGSHHVNLSSSRLTAAAQLPEHTEIVDEAIKSAQRKVAKGGNRKLVAMRAVERLPVAFAKRILNLIDGQVSVEVDGRLAFKRRTLIDKARTIMDLFEQAGIDKTRIVLKIPATWQGIEAAAKLRAKNDIQCHMTLVFGMHQVAASADAGATIIAPSVGRITDWHKKNDGVDAFSPQEDPGVQRAQQMHAYLRAHNYDTKLMPSTFRSEEQALALAGCDFLCLPPKLIDELATRQGRVERAVGANGDASVERLTVDQTTFDTEQGNDPVSQTKLTAGVKNLSWAVVSQEKQLINWIGQRQDTEAENSTIALFGTWDYDGDGFIDREEWNGSAAVFNALDRDNNGRISLEEMAAGLGAPYRSND
jgi:transaldolase